jgi:hypothetical protein
MTEGVTGSNLGVGVGVERSLGSPSLIPSTDKDVGVGGGVGVEGSLGSPLLIPSVNMTQDVAGSNVEVGGGVGVEGSLGSPLLIPPADKDDLDVTDGSARSHVKIGDSKGDNAAENSSSKEQISDMILEGTISATFKDSYAQTDRNDLLHDHNQLQQQPQQQQKQKQQEILPPRKINQHQKDNNKFQSPISNDITGLFTPPHMDDEYRVQNSDDYIYDDNEVKN